MKITASQVMSVFSQDQMSVPAHLKENITIDSNQYFSCHNLEIEGELYFIGDESTKNRIVGFANCSIGRMEFFVGNFQYLNFTDCDIDSIQFVGGNFPKVEFNSIHKDATIRSLYLPVGQNSLPVNISFSSYRIDDMQISGVVGETVSLSFTNILFKNFRFSNFNNSSSVKFTNIRFQSSEASFSILKSNLGPAEFYDVDFCPCSAIYIRNANVANCVFLNVRWPAKEQFFFYGADGWQREAGKDFETSGKGTAELVEFFRQIKFTYSKQGDLIHEHLFHGWEMEEHYKLLSWKNQFWVKSVIGLSSLTSNFGQSLVRPFVSIIFANSILFFLLIYMHAVNIDIPDDNSGWVYFGNYMAEFVRLCNPLHTNLPELKGVPFLIDTFMRIVSSYAIYNIIRASRRFVK